MLRNVKKQVIGCAVLCVALTCAAQAQSSAILWSTFESGGGTTSAVGSGQLQSSVGQTFVATPSHTGNSQVASGFLQGVKSGGTDAVKQTGSAVPRTYILEQNYPNPFNPTTTIRFALPQRTYVTLFVYNVLGQRVAELVNGEIEAGYHQVKFDGAGLASGVYLYQLKAGDFAQTRRLVLLK